MKEVHSKIKKNAQHILLQKLTVPLINLFITIYVIKKISVAEFGIYNLLYAVIGYLTLVSSIGLLNILQRYIPEYNTKKQYSTINALFYSSLAIRFILAIVFIAIIVIFGNFLNQILKVGNFSEYFEYFIIGMILFLEIQVVEVTLSSLLLNKYIMISYLISTLIKGGFTYYFLELNLGIKGLLLAETISYGVLLIIQILYFHFGFTKVNKSEKNKLSLKRLFRYGGLSYLDEFGETILDVKTDFFIITAFLGPSLVGLYGFGNRLMELISKVLPFKLLKSLIRPLFFSSFTEKNNSDDLNLKFNFLMRLIAFISFPIFMGLIVVADKVILFLFDEKYLPALHLVWIFSAFSIINSFQFPLQLVVQAKEKVEITFVSKIFSIYNLIGDLIVVKPFGIVGISLVTCSARLFQNIFIYYGIRKHTELEIEWIPIFKIFMNSLIMTGIIIMLRTFMINLYMLIFILIISGSLYLVISILNKSFSNRERELINNMLPRPIFLF